MQLVSLIVCGEEQERMMDEFELEPWMPIENHLIFLWKGLKVTGGRMTVRDYLADRETCPQRQ